MIFFWNCFLLNVFIVPYTTWKKLSGALIWGWMTSETSISEISVCFLLALSKEPTYWINWHPAGQFDTNFGVGVNFAAQNCSFQSKETRPERKKGQKERNGRNKERRAEIKKEGQKERRKNKQSHNLFDDCRYFVIEFFARLTVSLTISHLIHCTWVWLTTFGMFFQFWVDDVHPSQRFLEDHLQLGQTCIFYALFLLKWTQTINIWLFKKLVSPSSSNSFTRLLSYLDVAAKGIPSMIANWQNFVQVDWFAFSQMESHWRQLNEKVFAVSKLLHLLLVSYAIWTNWTCCHRPSTYLRKSQGLTI